MDQLKKRLKIKNILVRQCLSECLGTFILLIFGLSASAQVRTTQGMKGQYLSINMAFSVGLMVAMYMSRNVSGAHLNPAMSLCSCVMGQMPWAKLLPYCLSQVLGAYIASAVVFFMYYDAIMDYSSGILTVYGANETASIFATYPSEFLTLGSSFLDQAVGTGMIMMCYLPLVDIQNDPVPHNLVPPLVAVGILGISMAMSSNCGGAINPARDLGPRLLTLCAGWGTEVFTAYNYWFWVPIVAPMVGAVLASWIYVVIIQWHLPEMNLPQSEPEEPRSDLLPGPASHRSVENAFENGLELSQKL